MLKPVRCFFNLKKLYEKICFLFLVQPAAC